MVGSSSAGEKQSAMDAGATVTVSGTACYHGGAFFTAIGERFDHLDRAREIINADVLDAWFDPSPGVIEAMRSHLPWLSRTSPPTHSAGFIDAVSRARGIPAANLLHGAGSSDLIYLVLREWLAPRSRVLILDPMYGEYAHVLEQVVGCQVDRFPLDRSAGFAIALEPFRAALHRAYDLVILVNPNSPTGQYLPREVLEAAIRDAPGSTRFWIDETYIDYVGREATLEPMAVSSGNVIVCKSLSKAYALSGLRAAYLAGPAFVIAHLRTLTPPWAVSLPAQLAAVRALEEASYYAARWRETHDLRHELTERLVQAVPGLDVFQGVANFVLAFLPPDGPNAVDVIEACRARNLFLRDPRSMGAELGPHAVRIAVKDQATNDRMATILAGVWRALRAEICPSTRTALSHAPSLTSS